MQVRYVNQVYGPEQLGEEEKIKITKFGIDLWSVRCILTFTDIVSSEYQILHDKEFTRSVIQKTMPFIIRSKSNSIDFYMHYYRFF